MMTTDSNHSSESRSPSEDITDRPFDVLIIGGGIVGAGVARDAAMRGLRVVLVEQRDFASGTSSRSSRLLHGGIRYLAQGRVGLVWEASREKTVLSRIAPHLSESLPFVFPTRSRSGWPRWKLSLGVVLYDLLCGIRNLGRSRSLSVAKTRELLPSLAGTNLTGAVRYFDALTNDSRLVIDTLRSAVDHGAHVRNYVKLISAERESQFWRCELLDGTTGRTEFVSATTVVNATGPWSDRIPNSKTSLRLTKGVHLVVNRSRLNVSDAVVLTEGSRILFVIPWGERIILGTTDTDYAGPLEEPPCTDQDIDYVLGVVNQAFPTAKMSPADVISTWSGLRPLVADPNGKPSDISRRHKISMSQPGWWDVTGGKLTTYRLMAEETVNAISKHLNCRFTRSETGRKPLIQGEQARDFSGIIPPRITAEAVRHYCEHEWARHLDDVMLRRSSWRHYSRNHAETASRVANWMAQELSWSEDQRRQELQRYTELVGSEKDVAVSPVVKGPHMVQVNGHRRTTGASAETLP